MTKHADDELLPPTSEQTEYLRRQQNQYAKLSVTLRGDNTASLVATVTEQTVLKTTASKDEFDVECRRIFGPYIPEVENGRLRPYHKAFITRNQSRTPSGRFKILDQLRKYDLSGVSGFEARFNREPKELTEAKLREIEQSVGVDE
jgi:hypothetical protein